MHLVCLQSSVLHGVSWCCDNPNNNNNNNNLKSSRVDCKLERHDVVTEAWCLSGLQEQGLSSAGKR